MHVENFADIEAEFKARVETMVWCSVATVDRQGRPRSRVLHPIWEGNIGWIGTGAGTYKSKHIAANPYVSLAYITNIHRPIYADCHAEWVTDSETCQYVWNLFQKTPEPIGYDPEPTFGAVANFNVIKLTPWRINLVSFPAASMEAGTKVWRSKL
ncbi:MAG: pyridoxamine 5'-phosphate oxidase family protein [Anaerolineae bacterium]|nr:pyridoxamine 5'-phosphate oxidase family protein [Anaerolineae bacterium]MCA9894058.1 pyridoxamine 5'-phosphate oxidase family protein [Anaerolineae bacterium]